VTGEVFIPEHLILPQGVVPLCEDSRLRTAVLATLPTLDNSGLAARQTGGDPDRGIRIPGASGEQAVPSVARSGLTAKGKQAVAGSAASSSPSQAQSDGTPVVEPASKRQRTAEDADHRREITPPAATAAAARRRPREQQQEEEQLRVAPPPLPQEQQQQQKQSSSLRGCWRPGASGLVLCCSLPLFLVLRFMLKASSLCLPGLLAQAILPPLLVRQRGSR
jgi:hypothetical protein